MSDRTERTKYRQIHWALRLWLIATWPLLQSQLDGLPPPMRQRLLYKLGLAEFSGRTCCFCRERLIDPATRQWWDLGTVTVHHLNADHGDDRPENHALAHATCHRKHHMIERKTYQRVTGRRLKRPRVH